MLGYQRTMARKLFVYDEEHGELRSLMGRTRTQRYLHLLTLLPLRWRKRLFCASACRRRCAGGGTACSGGGAAVHCSCCGVCACSSPATEPAPPLL